MVDSGDEKTKQHEGYSPLHMFVIYLPAWIVLGENPMLAGNKHG
jgi:hypothetical protein